MGGLALPEDAAVLDAVSDPGGFVLAALDRAKAWLAQATTTDLPDVVEGKARAEAIRVYVAQKELGHDAELAAAEIVRRAERRMGQLIRQGQDEGIIAGRSDNGGQGRYLRGGFEVMGRPVPTVTKTSPADFLHHGKTMNQTYAVTDGVTDDQFEAALADAKAEANLSRANVIRKVKGDDARSIRAERADRDKRIADLAAAGHTTRQISKIVGLGEDRLRVIYTRDGIEVPADTVVAKTRRTDPNRIITETVYALEGVVIALQLVEVDELDREQVERWASSLNESLSKIRAFMKELTRD